MMPRQKDLKRLVRARMQKTGESYTTARSHLLSRKTPVGSRLPANYLELAGMSDEAVQRRTGRSWPEWVDVLDEAGAMEKSHRDIAKMLRNQHDLGGWWSQSVTGGYERIRGLREPGQRRGGGFDVNKSRTLAVPVSTLYRAFSQKRRRERWLDDVDWSIRTSRVDKSMRVGWKDGTRVDFHFIDKGTRKSQVTVQHRDLPDRASADRMRRFWTEGLDALARLLLKSDDRRSD